jgi:hypothetical protein
LKLVQGGSSTTGMANSGEVSCAKLAPCKVSLNESFDGADKNPLPYQRYFAYVHQIVHCK